MDVFKQALGGLPGGRALDLATGGGRFVHRLADNLPSYTEIIGVDPFDRCRMTKPAFLSGPISTLNK